MGFLFGLMIGSMAAGGGTQGAASVQSVLGTIPLRCIAAFERSEAEYRDCRGPSMRAELYQASRIFSFDGGAFPGCLAAANPGRYNAAYAIADCDVQKNLNWEVAALKEMEASAPKKPVTK